jgi:microcystin degradation protein MlrC
MKIAVAGLFHETNTFAVDRTEQQNFAGEWVNGNTAFIERYQHTRTSMGGVINAALAADAQLACGLYAAAMPSGMIERKSLESLLQAVVTSIDLRTDGILVILHGAMVGEQYPDVEGELLRRIREVAPHHPIAITLDLHANVSDEMVRHPDLIVGYDTYPHVDAYERAVEALQLLVKMIRGEIQPTRAHAKPRLLLVPQVMLTDQAGPMQEIMERAFAIEREPGVLNVTICGGFPYSDIADAGVSVVVTTDQDKVLAERYAKELSELFWVNRTRLQHQGNDVGKAIHSAFQEENSPVIIVESSDNVGGGAPADATHVLQHLLNAPKRSLIVIRDAEAARSAHQLGVGALFDGEIGGKSDDLHGNPVRIRGYIRLLSDGKYAHVGSYMTGQWADMGRTAVIEVDQLTVVLTEHRTAPWDPGHVTSLGIRPEEYHLIIVKSAIAWKTAFGSIAKRIIPVDTPGCCGENLFHFPYQHLSRPIFPLDPNANGGHHQ